VELTIGRNVSLEQALQLRDQWRDGNVNIAPASWIVLFPQFVNPSPPLLADVRFRKALISALDRQEMVDSLQAGLTPVADSFLALDEPEYPDVQASIVRYPFDPRGAMQAIEGLGYARGPDGSWREAGPGGQPLHLEIRTLTGIEINQKALFSAADYWQRIGLAVEPVVINRARAGEREFIATFPGFQVVRQGSTVGFLTNRRSSSAPMPETNFVGQNYARYMDPAFDALIDRFFVTVPRAERMEVLRQVIHQMTDEVHFMGLFFDGTPNLVGKRITGVTARAEGWNAHLWDVP
jgi:ABC-type transport system substrate-binding protein